MDFARTWGERHEVDSALCMSTFVHIISSWNSSKTKFKSAATFKIAACPLWGP